jgi:hypothetical protein
MEQDPDAVDSLVSDSDPHPRRDGPPSWVLALMSLAVIMAVIALVVVGVVDAIDDACSAWFMRPC